jgi:predicted acylesterase/phospholipase RssA
MAMTTTHERPRVTLGLALSGGGLRAAFFHIGVLAQLATLGLLRRVEVLSTVSGGSIVGALYYLHVKALLESKEDAEITDRDYVTIVSRMERDFLRATENDLRTRTFSSLRANLRMRRPDYSRSDRIAALYDEYIYRPLWPGSTSMIRMRDLRIGPDVLDPVRDNPSRSAKIPILLINATVLNDGHMWRFEAVRMGESWPSRCDREIDTNMILARPPSWEDMVERQQDFRLGHAVAASACFPAFPPLAVSGMYPHRLRVQLVDGGVHDNQGVEGLHDRGCTHLIVSDASGQMTDDPDPTGSTLGALLREAGIQGDRMREQELLRLKGPTSAVLHLRCGLAPTVVPYLRPGQAEGDATHLPSTTGDFHVDPRVQDLLSQMRTDLDAFTEVEACSLMLDGYLIAGAIVPRKLATDAGGAEGLGDLLGARLAASAEPWGFLRMAPLLAEPSALLLRHLTVAKSRFLKAARLVPVMGGVLGVLATVPLAVLVIIVGALWDPVLTRPVAVGWVAVTALLVLPVVLLPYLAHRIAALRWLRGPLDAVVRHTTWTVLAPLSWLIAQVALRIVDPAFLRAGRLARVAPEGAARE